jgi:hypothetical protein
MEATALGTVTDVMSDTMRSALPAGFSKFGLLASSSRNASRPSMSISTVSTSSDKLASSDAENTISCTAGDKVGSQHVHSHRITQARHKTTTALTQLEQQEQ